MCDKDVKALDLLERALLLMDEQGSPLVAARIAAAIDDLQSLARDTGRRSH